MKYACIYIWDHTSRGAFSIVRRVKLLRTSVDYAAKIINTKRLNARGESKYNTKLHYILMQYVAVCR